MVWSGVQKLNEHANLSMFMEKWLQFMVPTLGFIDFNLKIGRTLECHPFPCLALLPKLRACINPEIFEILKFLKFRVCFIENMV